MHACREKLALKKVLLSIISKVQLALVGKEESGIQKPLHVYDSWTWLVGDGLLDSTQVKGCDCNAEGKSTSQQHWPIMKLAQSTWLCSMSSTNLKQTVAIYTSENWAE